MMVFPQNIKSENNQKLEILKRRNQQYYQLRKLIGEKRYEETITKCNSILEKDLEFIGVYPLLALSSKRINKLDNSIIFLEELVKKYPKNPHLLYGLGQCYINQGKTKETIVVYKKAIDLKTQNFFIYYQLVNLVKTDDERNDLINYYKKKMEMNPDNSFLYYGLGALNQFVLKKYDTALNYYHQALTTSRKNSNLANQAKHLNSIGYYYWARSDFNKALEYFELAREAAHKADDKYREASFLYNCGLIYCNLGKWEKAKKLYTQALHIDRETGNKLGEAGMLRGIGFCSHRSNQYSKALDYYRQALKISREFTDKNGESKYLADIARVYWDRSHYTKAIKYQKEALKIAQELGNKYNIANTLDSMGSTYWKIGQYSKALESYFQALKMARDLDNKKLEANYLVNIGNIYRHIGNHSKALENCQKALLIHRNIGSKESEGVNLSNMGAIYYDLGDYSLSLKYFHKALAMAQETGDRKAEAIRLINIANNYAYLGINPQAKKHFDDSLKIIKELGNKASEVYVHWGYGDLFFRLKDYAKSLHFFNLALKLAEDLGMLLESGESHFGLAQVYEKQEKYSKAFNHYQRAIECVENARSQFVLKEHKISLVRKHIKFYESAVFLLLQLHWKQPSGGYEEVAFHYVEKAKARGFLDKLQEVKVNLRENLTAELRVEENQISSDISKIQTELTKPELTDSSRKGLFQKLKEKEEDYQRIIQRIKRDNPRYANLVYPEPKKLKDIQGSVIDEVTALIEYFLGEKHSLAFFITKKDISIHELPSGKKLQERVNDYIKLLSTRTKREFSAFAAGQKLYQDLMGPFKTRLTSIKKLVIIPDGNLHYLPFETLLPEDSVSNLKFMVENFKISYAPSATSLIHLLDRQKGAKMKKDLLALADPVYTPVKKSLEKLDVDAISREVYLDDGFIFFPLKYSGEEVKKISKYINGKFKDIFTKKEAREEIIKESSIEDYKILHFATHGLLDEKVPMRSALVLSLDQDPKEDGFYQVREIYNTKLNSDLVILSACQTGKGQLEKGEGVSGLSRAFLHAGAQSVLVSLWNINDRATSEFMGYFYKYLYRGESKEKALQLTKLRMLKSKYAHPFFWAPFVLIGDYQSTVKLTKPTLWERIF
jgi:CHAT domain-containing protein/Tfp pilus assembly protein PilF